MRNLSLALALFLWLGGLGAACSDSAKAPAATPTPRVIAIPVATPALPIMDPAFEALPGAKAFFGEVAGTVYRFETPEKWNGDLVMYVHGWRRDPPLVGITIPLPVREYAIQQGFAWAASSCRSVGYNPDDCVQDTLILRELFKQKVGTPKRTYIYGTSMGGNSVVSSLERYPDIYAGGLSECGGVNGVGRLDYLLSYAALASYFSKADLLGPEAKTAQDFATLLNEKVYPALGDAPERLTNAGKGFRNAMINMTGGHRPFAEEGFNATYRSNFVLASSALFDPTFRSKALSNADERYQIDPGFGVDSAALNAAVKRITADPYARNFEAHYEFTSFKGNLKVPLLTIHGTGDFQVPIRAEQQYGQVVDQAGATNMIVQRAVRRFVHCDFSPAERVRAFSDLVAWVTTGVRPEGEDLRGSFAEVGSKWTEPMRPDDPGRP